MATKPCTRCGAQPKAPGKHQCQECLEEGWAPTEREAAAAERLAMIPVSLRVARVPEAKWPAGRRWCAGCQSFVRFRDCRGGSSQCRTCVSRREHAAMVRRTYVIHGRPFTEDDYADLFRAQGGRCKICGDRPRVKRLAVDHDHDTGEVRGLLCPDNEFGCNRAVLGNIKDLAMARRIVAYLEKNWAHQVIAR